MKETPILYKREMVKAILDGRKTKTRRLNGLEKINENPDDWMVVKYLERSNELWFKHKESGEVIYVKCPFGKAGDLLWVRETWGEIIGGIVYKASDLPDNVVDNLRWKPSLFMPKSVCRLWLRIKDIRVERLQDITEEDAKAEGVTLRDNIVKENNPEFTHKYRWAFCLLWESINKKTHPWESNPWVWVIEFERVEKLNEVKV
jgi:hypothetical protein